MKEKDLYPKIKKFLEGKYGKSVLYSGIRKGVKRSPGGIIDVVLARGIYSNVLNTCEVISVEVKPNKRSLLNSIGQSLGYSIFSDRCYLAIQDKFNQKEIDTADSLGVGLIEINKKGGCKEILASKLFTPDEHLKLTLLYNLNVYKCPICSSYFVLEKFSQKFSKAIENKISYYLRLKEQDKKLIKEGLSERKSRWVGRCICKDCISGIFSELKEIFLK